MLLLPSSGSAAQHHVANVALESYVSHEDVEHKQEKQCFVNTSVSNRVATITSTTTQCVTPMVRTLPYTVRSIEQNISQSKAANAIDSTMAAYRYGLFNHKILFVSHPRMHYLHRFVRLII